MAPAVITPPAPPAGQNAQVINGIVGVGASGAQSCYFGRPCEIYGFSLEQDGGVDVTLTWQGHERALMIQLYRAGSGLVHEDLAPRGSAPRISFRRTDLTAMDYEFRVVNMDNAGTMIPFTLAFTRLN